MTTPQAPTKAELLAALRSSGQQVVDRVRGMPPEELEQGRYENGWNGRQIPAHIASIEWTYTRLFDVAKQGAPAPSNDVGAHLDAPWGGGGADACGVEGGSRPALTGDGGASLAMSSRRGYVHSIDAMCARI